MHVYIYISIYIYIYINFCLTDSDDIVEAVNVVKRKKVRKSKIFKDELAVQSTVLEADQVINNEDLQNGVQLEKVNLTGYN